MQVETLLSDRFAEFAGRITALHERKKEMITEFKRLYEEHKVAVKAIDEEAANLHVAFTDGTKAAPETKK
jgi:ribosome recycling factor